MSPTLALRALLMGWWRDMEWRKARASNWNGNCVEIAQRSATVLVRDSKRPEAGHLTVTRDAFSRFLADLKHQP